MGSFDISCDRIRPINTMEPLIQQETELLTFSPIIGQPQKSPLIKKNYRKSRKHSQFERRSPTFLTIKYGFVAFVIASSVATLCDINLFRLEPFNDYPTNNQTLKLDNLTSYETINGTSINNQSNQQLIVPMVPMIILSDNSSVPITYRDWVYHKMKIPLYVYMSVSIGVLFMAIFGRTMENFFIPFGFGMFMILEIVIMLTLCLRETEFNLRYSPQLWTIYILHLIFSLSYSLIIAITNHQHF